MLQKVREVNDWSKVEVDYMWKKEVYNFCITHEDIKYAYVMKHVLGEQFVIVMDDSTNDNVIQYNEFGFEIMSKYRNKIADFMILDVYTSDGLEELYDDVKILFKRSD